MYQEFRIKIERRDGGGFEVSASGPAGEVEGAFQVPLDEKDLRLLILEMGVPRGLVRGLDAPAGSAARELGGKLYRALFGGDVGVLFLRSRDLAEARGDWLRITLSLTDAPDLMHFPWEYLYDEGGKRFLAVSIRTPVVRYLEIPSQRRPMLVTPPLRILGMVSSPTDVAQLDTGLERSRLEQAVAELQARKLVEITWLETASLDALQEELRRRDYHVFHYIGHGGFDPREDESVLLLEENAERAQFVSGEQLGTMLFDHTSLSLAVLNACEAARTSTRDPFAGVASSLVRQEIPAVIAMQFPITDKAAIRFSSTFYRALADGLPVDAAMAEARKAMFAADPDNVEWGTPVLFMRVSDGRVFELDRSALPEVEEAEAERVPAAPPTGDNGAAVEERAPPPVAPPPPPVSPPPRPPPRPSLSERLRRRRVPLLGAVVLLGLGVVLGIVFAGGNETPGPTPPAVAPPTGEPPGPPEEPPVTPPDGGNGGLPEVLAASAVPLGGAEGATRGGLSASWSNWAEVLYVSAPGTRSDPRPLIAVEADRPVTQQLLPDGTNDFPTASVNAEVVFQHIAPGQGWEIYVLRGSDFEVEELVAEPEDQVTPSWSPDGEFVVYSSLADGSTLDLQVVRRDATEQTALAIPEQEAWDELFPAWSLDGMRLAFVRTTGGKPQCPQGDLWLADYDPGSRQVANVRPLVQGFGDVRHPSWSPDGYIVFSANPEGDRYRLYAIDPQASELGPIEIEIDGLSGTDAVDPSSASDGSNRIAFGAGSFRPCEVDTWAGAPWLAWGRDSEIRVLTFAAAG